MRFKIAVGCYESFVGIGISLLWRPLARGVRVASIIWREEMTTDRQRYGGKADLVCLSPQIITFEITCRDRQTDFIIYYLIKDWPSSFTDSGVSHCPPPAKSSIKRTHHDGIADDERRLLLERLKENRHQQNDSEWAIVPASSSSSQY